MNSHFTKGVVESVWRGLGGEKGVGIVYPCVTTQRPREQLGKNSDNGDPASQSSELWKDKKVLLSINRFERKKDIGLAIKAFAGLNTEDRKDVRLVLAGQ